MKKRFFNTILLCVIMGILGLLLLIIFNKTGRGIPCPVYTLLGILCPSCGAQRMLGALFNGDFAGAYSYNAAFFIALPLLGALFVWQMVHYIKHGNVRANKIFNIICVLLIIYFIGFGILRNF